QIVKDKYQSRYIPAFCCCGLKGIFFGAIRGYRSIVRHNVALRLLIQHIDIVVGQVDGPHPVAGGINGCR
ncbi:TPA: hypothetical protein ACN7PH_003537, partial [Klebsiella pneumoniae]